MPDPFPAAPVQHSSYIPPTPSAWPPAEEPRAYEYTTFPRAFVSYRWFKPLLVFLLGFVFLMAFGFVLVGIAATATGSLDFLYTIGTSYDDMDAYTGPGALLTLGSVAVMLPALALAALIVRDRPYSSYSSSRDGWNWGAFAKCLGVAAVLMGISLVVETVFFPSGASDGVMRFTVVGFVLCTLLVPFQCVAEEYFFRGWLMQTVGAWTRLPVLAVLVQALVFAAMHPYNLIGVATILIDGLAWGVIAWRTKGLEASSALHIMSNMVAFYFTGLGLDAISSEIDLLTLVLAGITALAYLLIVLYANSKWGWFDAKKDGAAEFNQKRMQRLAQRTQTPPEEYWQGTLD